MLGAMLLCVGMVCGAAVAGNDSDDDAFYKDMEMLMDNMQRAHRNMQGYLQQIKALQEEESVNLRNARKGISVLWQDGRIHLEECARGTGHDTQASK